MSAYTAAALRETECFVWRRVTWPRAAASGRRAGASVCVCVGVDLGVDTVGAHSRLN